MTTTATPFNGKKTALWGLGLGLLALPFAMPSAAHADNVKISLNFGNAPYGYSYHQPVVQKVVYKPAPKRNHNRKHVKNVVVKHPNTKVVYVTPQRGHGHGYGNRHWQNGRHGYERRVAYYY